MSKIVQAVNAMITNQSQISNVQEGEREIFFLFKERYKWSMHKDDSDHYYLFYYPGKTDLDELSNYQGDDWEGIPIVTYTTQELGTKEARASFAELYSILKERLYGMNDVLDDIISNPSDQ